MTDTLANKPLEVAEEDAAQNDDLAALAALCQQRSATYQMLSRLYRVEVDESFLKELKGMRFPANTGNAAVDAGYKAMAKYLSGAGEHSLVELAVDYVRTFVGHGMDAYSAAYPFESVYTSPKRLMMQDARDEVLALYKSEGLDKIPSWRESEDHVALEFELMATLAERTADALAAENVHEAQRLLEVQRSFLEDHLTSWVALLTADVRKFAESGLYVGLADVTDGYLQVETELFAELFSDEEDEQ